MPIRKIISALIIYPASFILAGAIISAVLIYCLNIPDIKYGTDYSYKWVRLMDEIRMFGFFSLMSSFCFGIILLVFRRVVNSVSMRLLNYGAISCGVIALSSLFLMPKIDDFLGSFFKINFTLTGYWLYSWISISVVVPAVALVIMLRFKNGKTPN